MATTHNMQPDTFPTIHQLHYTLEHPLLPADPVKHHQPDDDDDEHQSTLVNII